MDALFQNPIGLTALAALPAILALHLFRRRFRPRTVSALFLWAPDDRTILTGRRIERLRNTASLWLELAAALALALAISGPRGCGGSSAEHLVVVLDGSASMLAGTTSDARSEGDGGDGAGSAREAALAALRERIGELPADSRVSLVESGARPRLLAGPAALPAEALARLEGYVPRARTHALAPALALARELADGGAVLLVTDRYEPEAHAPDVEIRALGEPVDNVAIVRAERLRASAEGAAEIASIGLRSFAAREVALRVRVTAVDALGAGAGAGAARLHELEVALGAGEERTVSFDVPAGVGGLELRLVAPRASNQLEIDDAAFLAPVPERALSLWNALAPQHSAALGLDAQGDAADGARAQRLRQLVPRSIPAESAADAHLVLASGDAGGPSSYCLAIEAPMAEGGAEAGETRAWLAPFLTEKAHPLFDGVSFQGVVWSGQPARELPGAPLVSAGSTALIREERTGARRVFRLNLDPARSTLGRSPDWPVLLSNLAELRRAELPGAARVNLRSGERFTWRGEPGAYELARGSWRAEQRSRGVLELDLPDEPGFYRLSHEGQLVSTLGVTFVDARQSDLSRRASGRRPAEVASAAATAEESRLEAALLALALAAAVIDWWVLQRKSRPRVEP